MSSSALAGAHKVEFFPQASAPYFENCHFIGENPSAFDPLNLLYAEVAPNAILNAGGRADPLRCHAGTRVEVLSQVETWIASGYRQDRRIFWLSGPAGAGKSAIVQTLAETCIRRKSPMANFFFFRSDPSRNHSRSVVPTLLYQLLQLFPDPDLTSTLSDIISRDRLIFKKSIRDQFMLLIDGPFRELWRRFPDQPPIVLLIDGLDECDSRFELDAATMSEQSNLLYIVHNLVVSHPESPFIALVASRDESHIRMAFNHIGRTRDSVYLNNTYSPDEDIRHYTTCELSRIKGTHPLGPYLDPEWPPPSIINDIVEKSSGQFIYPSTVLRFIANSAQSPALSMDIVLSQGLRPANLNRTRKRSPFAEIDAIYLFILSRSEHWECAREIIAVDAMYRGAGDNMTPFSSLGYSPHEALSFFADLTSIMKVKVALGYVKLEFYHASFKDFIYSASRAGTFHIDLTDFANSLAPRVLSAISNNSTLKLAAAIFNQVNLISESLTSALKHLPPVPMMIDAEEVKKQFLGKVEQLYSKQNPELYREIRIILEGWRGPGDDLLDRESRKGSQFWGITVP